MDARNVLEQLERELDQTTPDPVVTISAPILCESMQDKYKYLGEILGWFNAKPPNCLVIYWEDQMSVENMINIDDLLLGIFMYNRLREIHIHLSGFTDEGLSQEIERIRRVVVKALRGKNFAPIVRCINLNNDFDLLSLNQDQTKLFSPEDNTECSCPYYQAARKKLKIKDYGAALAYFNQAIASGAYFYFDAYSKRAMLHCNNNAFAAAISDSSTVLSSVNSDPIQNNFSEDRIRSVVWDSLYVRALSYSQTKQYENALTDLIWLLSIEASEKYRDEIKKLFKRTLWRSLNSHPMEQPLCVNMCLSYAENDREELIRSYVEQIKQKNHNVVVLRAASPINDVDQVEVDNARLLLTSLVKNAIPFIHLDLNVSASGFDLNLYNQHITAILELVRANLSSDGKKSVVTCSSNKVDEYQLNMQFLLLSLPEVESNPNLVWIALAQMYSFLGEFTQVIRVSDAALRNDPNNYQLWLCQANANKQLGNLRLAYHHYTVAITCLNGARDDEPYYKRARLCYENADTGNPRSFQLVLDDLNQALAINPQNADTLRDRIRCYEAMNNYQMAFAEINRLLKVDFLEEKTKSWVSARYERYAQRGLTLFDLQVTPRHMHMVADDYFPQRSITYNFMTNSL